MSYRNQEEKVYISLFDILIGIAVLYVVLKILKKLFCSDQPQYYQPQYYQPQYHQPILYVPESTQILPEYRNPSNSGVPVVDTVEGCKEAMKKLRSHCDEFGILGFDCEWVSRRGIGRCPIALVQLSSYKNFCVLVRLSKLKHIPKELKEILEDDNILKIGVGITDDAKYLFRDYLKRHEWDHSNPIRGIFELGRLATMVNCEGEGRSLSFLVEKYLGETLDKKPELRCCDWEADTLSYRQIIYAATDAIVAIRIFEFFGKKFESAGLIGYRMRKTINACLEKSKMEEML